MKFEHFLGHLKKTPEFMLSDVTIRFTDCKTVKFIFPNYVPEVFGRKPEGTIFSHSECENIIEALKECGSFSELMSCKDKS